MNKRKGFTLIELLVVISIIAMLLAILMPALGKVKEKARQVTCAAQMHSIGLVMNIYGADNYSKLPTAKVGDYGRWLFDVPWNIAELIRIDYGMETMYCPANNLKNKGGKLTDHYLSHMNGSSSPKELGKVNGGWAVTDYFWLMELNNESNNWRTATNWVYPSATRNKGKKLFNNKLSVKQASSYPLVIDAVFTQSSSEPYDFSQVAGGQNMIFKSNHLNGSDATGGNVLNCDGSVSWTKFDNMERNYSDGSVKHFW